MGSVQKTVTLSLKEYDELVNAQKAADVEMRKAKAMINKRKVEIVLHRDRELYFHRLSLGYDNRLSTVFYDEPVWFFGEGEIKDKAKEIIEQASKHIQGECETKIKECNEKTERCNEIINKLKAYNAKGAWHRFFNKFEF